MSRIFYDHLIIFEEIDIVIKETVHDSEEREELWGVVDELVHIHILTLILDKLPSDHQLDFLEKYHDFPYDHALIEYLNERIGQNVEEVIKKRMKELESEILQEIRALKL